MVSEDAEWHRLTQLADVASVIVETVGGTMRMWPRLQRQLFMQRNLTYAQRFLLVVFLLHNACNPVLMLEYFHLNGSLRDMQALRHVQSLIRSWQNDAEWCKRYYTFDFYHGGLRRLDGSPYP